MKAPLLSTIPWFSLVLVALAYGLLGWHLSAYHFLWSIGSFIAAVMITVCLIWGGKAFGELFRLGPRSVVTMLILSSVITLAVAASTLFAMIIILVLTKVLARLQMQSAGFSKHHTLGVVSLSAGLGLSLGWIVSKFFVSSSTYWLDALWNSLKIMT
jgi:hypothetical protein